MRRTLVLTMLFASTLGNVFGQTFEWVGTTAKIAFENKSYKITGTLTLSDGFNVKAAVDGDFFAKAVKPDTPMASSIGYRDFTATWEDDLDATGTTHEIRVVKDGDTIVPWTSVSGLSYTFSGGSGCDSENYEFQVRYKYNSIWIESDVLSINTLEASLPLASELNPSTQYYWPDYSEGGNATSTSIDWSVRGELYNYGIDYIDVEVIDSRTLESFGENRLILAPELFETSNSGVKYLPFTTDSLEANRVYDITINKACNIDVASLEYEDHTLPRWTNINVPLIVTNAFVTFNEADEGTLEIYYDWKDYYGDPITHRGELRIKHIDSPTQGTAVVNPSNQQVQYILSDEFDFEYNSTYNFSLSTLDYVFKDEFTVETPATGARLKSTDTSETELNEKITISPNPVIHQLSISIGDNLKLEKTVIRDLSGRVIFSNEVSPDQEELILELDQLERGIYLIEGYHLHQKVFSEKIIKE